MSVYIDKYHCNDLALGIDEARAVAGHKKVSVCAADVAQQYLEAGLLDEIQVSVVPIPARRRCPLVGDLKEPVALERTRVIESPGVTHLDFRV